MASKPIVSMNKVAEQISNRHNRSLADVYKNIRYLVDEGIVQEAGIEVFRQESARGNHKFTYHFSDFERTIEVWEQSFLKGEAYSRVLIHCVVNYAQSLNGKASTFPAKLLHQLTRYLKDTE